MLKVAWSIAGFDTSGGAGITLDAKVFENFKVHCCPILSCLAIQNNHRVEDIYSFKKQEIDRQFATLKNTFLPSAAKIGLVSQIKRILPIANWLNEAQVPIVQDPVLSTSSGYLILDKRELKVLIKHLLPTIFLLTPNILEAERILNCKIQNDDQVELAANKLLEMGVRQVILKGGHRDSEASADFWTDGKDTCWLSSPRFSHELNIRGTGCAFSSALTACLAKGDSVLDAFVKAKAYVSQGIATASKLDEKYAFISSKETKIKSLPSYKGRFISAVTQYFPPCQTIGFYPIVDNFDSLVKLAGWNVKMIQLRLKGIPENELEAAIVQAVRFSKEKNVKLIINDYWALAIKYQAYGVHLGQEDLERADLKRVAEAGLCLGLSCHSYLELTVAETISPSYVAVGPVFVTNTKPERSPLSIKQLCEWRDVIKRPLVAIGGISLQNVGLLSEAKLQGVAVISALQVPNLELDVKKWRAIEHTVLAQI